MLYTLAQIRSQVAQYCGIRNTAGAYDFDNSTFPTIDLANNMINDSFREICAEWDYTFLETTKSYPFFHVIEGVQSVWLSGTATFTNNPISGSITPYPNDVLNYAWQANNTVQNINNNFSGITFNGQEMVSPFGLNTGISNSGAVTTNNWTGVGFTYQLDQDIDKFMVPGIFVPHSNNGLSANGILLKNIDYEDMIRIFPIGTIQASGTPIYFSEAPGLSNVSNNGKQIVFGPTPNTNTYSGNSFVAFYKKKHVDLQNDYDVQTVIPEQWQNMPIKLACAKVFAISDPSRVDTSMNEAAKLMRSCKLWDAKQPSKVRRWRDSNYDTNSSFLYDSSSWFTLGTGGR